MNRISILFALFSLVLSISIQAKNPVYKDKNAPIESRVKDLVSKMTIEEKILQLNQYIAGINTNVNLKCLFYTAINKSELVR